MLTINNVHQQFAAFFNSDRLKPFAYLVSKKISEGHICVALQQIKDDSDMMVWQGKNKVNDYISVLRNEPLVTTKDGPKQPFVLHNDKLYLQRYFHYETIILNRIHQFISDEKKLFEDRKNVLQQHQTLVQKFFAPRGEENKNTDWQLVATITALLNNFTIITGGPGTGKTTTVAKILALLFSIYPTLKVALAAPTGKAATRMAESLKAASSLDNQLKEKFQSLVPATLHRLLKIAPGATKAGFNKTNPLDYDLIIVDESSMMDVALFARLMDATGNNTRLILLGDKDQLASVEAGSLFGDLCKAQPVLNLFSAKRAAFINSFFPGETGKVVDKSINETIDHPLFQHIVELRSSHRFTDNEGIGKFSKAIIGNDIFTINNFFKTGFDKQINIETTYSQDMFSEFVSGYTAYIQEKDIATAIKKFNSLRVLCAVRQGNHGLYAINKKIEMLLQQKGLIKGIGEFYEHRPLMITKNYYDLQLFNGDVGIIRADQDGVLRAWFIDSQQNIRSVLPAFVAESETAYAMTIHKSQGSEFDQVLIVLPDAAEMELLTRELLYTAVTRARKKAIIQGSEQIILETARRSVTRISGIVERFEERE